MYFTCSKYLSVSLWSFVEKRPHYLLCVLKDQAERFFCDESVCEGTLPVNPAEEKHCVKVKGEMQKMSIRGTHEYCAMPRKEASHMLNGRVI